MKFESLKIKDVTKKKDLKTKSFVVYLWRHLLTLYVFMTNIKSSRDTSEKKVFFGGSRTGDIGGPLIKLKLLKKYFPESFFSYNIVYTLSNAAYLNPLAIYFLKKRRIPLILNQNGIFYPAWYNGDWEKKNAHMAHMYHKADYVFWQSKFCKDSADKFLGIRKGPGEILYNAVDTRHFKPALIKNKKKIFFNFLVTGKFDNHLFYRIECTIKGLKLARDRGLNARLIIAGWISNDTLVNIRDLISSLNLNKNVIRIIGPYTYKKAPYIYRLADAYIMTKYMDPCPNSVLEAMATGLPILYSNSGGTPELVGNAGISMQVPEDGNDAIYVPSSESICQGMINIKNSAHKKGIIARKRVVTYFDSRSWKKRHEAIFNKFFDKNKLGI